MRHLIRLLPLPCLVLSAQERIQVPRPSEPPRATFQLRATRAGATLEAAGAEATGGGAGFALLLGDAPLKLKVSMDGDAWGSRGSQGSLQGLGLSAQAWVDFPLEGITPFATAGPVFQHWILGSGPAPGDPRRTANKLAFRGEAGVFLHPRFALSLGALTGSLEPGRRATLTYLAFTFR